MQTQTNNKEPIAKYGGGNIQIAKWINTRKAKEGNQEYKIESYKIQKQYKDEETGQWKDTNYYNNNELQKLKELIEQALSEAKYKKKE